MDIIYKRTDWIKTSMTMFLERVYIKQIETNCTKFFFNLSQCIVLLPTFSRSIVTKCTCIKETKKDATNWKKWIRGTNLRLCFWTHIFYFWNIKLSKRNNFEPASEKRCLWERKGDLNNGFERKYFIDELDVCILALLWLNIHSYILNIYFGK